MNYLKINKYFFCALFFLFTLNGCKQDEKSTVRFTKSIDEFLTKNNQIKTIFLDSLSSSNSSLFQYVQSDNKSFLYILNTLNNHLEKYDFDSGKLISKQKLYKEGPNGVGQVNNFYVHSTDSIFIVATYQFKLTLIDSLGNVKKRYSILGNTNSNKEILGQGSVSYGDEAGKITVYEKKVFISASPFDDPNHLSYYTKGAYGLIIDIETGDTKTIMKLPDHWKENFKNGYRLTSQENIYGQDYNLKKKICILSLFTESELYTVNLETNQINKYNAGSSKLSKIPWMSRKVNNFEEEFSLFIEGGFYPAIHYDSYRDRYLRFVAIPNHNKKGDDGKPWVTFNIIILDSTFKIIEEIELTEEYISSNIIITHDQLFLKLKSSDENKMIFMPVNFETK